MSISLNVLHHLGINLYSNSVAVITESVANGWDADASLVIIDIDSEHNAITIEDDGIGMTVEEINDRFLHIGYNRRKSLDTVTTPKGRNVMGRKGLGKLSLFSIAQSIKIYTKKIDGNVNAFFIDVKKIEAQISQNDVNQPFDYEPEEIVAIPPNIISNASGTTIVLSDLKKSRITSESQLRARLARRFSVIGQKHGFVVKVNDADIALSDRHYYKKLQYIWLFGDQQFVDEITNFCGTTLLRNLVIDETIPNTNGSKITGWIGTVSNSGQLKDENAGNLNGIVLLARGRIIQENILDNFSDGRLYTKYLIGEINADFLDDNLLPDMAASSRQKLIEDDERYSVLTSYLKSILNDIANKWTEYRNEDGVKEAVHNYPKVAEWLEKYKVKPDTRKAAVKIIGHIQSLPVDKEDDRKELLKHGIIAFERLRINDQLSKLDSLLSFDSTQFQSIVSNVDEIEASLYYQTIQGRISVIKQLENLAENNVLEKEIHQYVFDHLWLLDPSWERATGSELMEQAVAKEFGKIETLTEDELKGRLDIRYKKSAGSHVIIELKRFFRPVTASELYEQAKKYKNALAKCLTKQNELTPNIEIIFLLGDKPKEDNPGETAQLFQLINARFLTYKQIVHSAMMTYSDYLEQNKEAGTIREIISSL